MPEIHIDGMVTHMPTMQSISKFSARATTESTPHLKVGLFYTWLAFAPGGLGSSVLEYLNDMVRGIVASFVASPYNALDEWAICGLKSPFYIDNVSVNSGTANHVSPFFSVGSPSDFEFPPDEKPDNQRFYRMFAAIIVRMVELELFDAASFCFLSLPVEARSYLLDSVIVNVGERSPFVLHLDKATRGGLFDHIL